MVTKIQRHREELSDRIKELEQGYSSTLVEQRNMDFVARALEEWVRYKSALEELYGGKTSIQVYKRRRFLAQVKADFSRGMDELMEDYETQPHRDFKFVEQTYQRVGRYIQLYLKSGVDIKDKKHVTYIRFLEQLKGELEPLKPKMASKPNAPPRRKNTFEKETIYKGIIQISEHIGTAQPFQLVLVTDTNDDIYWATLREIGFHSPDDTYFPIGKKLSELTQENIALTLAKAYKRENRMRGIQIPYEHEVLSTEIQIIVPGLVTQIYESVKKFRNGGS